VNNLHQQFLSTWAKCQQSVGATLNSKEVVDRCICRIYSGFHDSQLEPSTKNCENLFIFEKGIFGPYVLLMIVEKFNCK